MILKDFVYQNVGTSNTTLYGVPAGAGSSALENYRYWYYYGE